MFRGSVTHLKSIDYTKNYYKKNTKLLQKEHQTITKRTPNYYKKNTELLQKEHSNYYKKNTKLLQKEHSNYYKKNTKLLLKKHSTIIKNITYVTHTQTLIWVWRNNVFHFFWIKTELSVYCIKIILY